MDSNKKLINIITTQEELIMLNNALNEALSEIEDWEFETRIGSSKKEARSLMTKIGKFIVEA
jgi:hypothetical protein